MPLIFVLGAVTAIGTGNRFGPSPRPSRCARSPPGHGDPGGDRDVRPGHDAHRRAGFIAVSALKFPPALLYAGIAVAMPAFGSAYAASSVLGVPLVYVFLGRNELVVTSALSLDRRRMGDSRRPLRCSASSRRSWWAKRTTTRSSARAFRSLSWRC